MIKRICLICLTAMFLLAGCDDADESEEKKAQIPVVSDETVTQNTEEETAAVADSEGGTVGFEDKEAAEAVTDGAETEDTEAKEATPPVEKPGNEKSEKEETGKKETEKEKPAGEDDKKDETGKGSTYVPRDDGIRYTSIGISFGNAYLTDNEYATWFVELYDDGTGYFYNGDDNEGVISSWSTNGDVFTMKEGGTEFAGDSTLKDGVLVLDYNDWMITYASPEVDRSKFKVMSLEDDQDQTKN